MATEREKQLVLEMFKWRHPKKEVSSDPRVEEGLVRSPYRMFYVYTHHSNYPTSVSIPGSIFQEEDPVKAYKIQILSERIASANESIEELTLDLEDTKACLANCERQLEEVQNGSYYPLGSKEEEKKLIVGVLKQTNKQILT